MMAHCAVERRIDGVSVDSVLCGLAMTVYAPAHRQSFKLPNSFHRFHRPVTFLTLNASRHMSTVVEADEVRQIVNLHPFDRLLLSTRFGQLRIVQTETVIKLLQFPGNNGVWFALFLICFRDLFLHDIKGTGDEFVALHADIRRWDTSVLALFGCGVAKAAIDAKFSSVQTMRVTDWLRR